MSNIVIIGAGPTGVGAALRLVDLSIRDWVLIEAGSHVGGLSTTDCTGEGFLFDMGGHVLFSHYPYFDSALDSAGLAWREHVRAAYVYMHGTRIPYPFQLNVTGLPEPIRSECIEGALASPDGSTAHADNFDDWFTQGMGEGIARHFMRPYNRKVWATDPADMGTGWLGERVATIDKEELQRRAASNTMQNGWGPNSTFRFPQDGGTGAIYKQIVEQFIAPHHVRLDTRVVGFSEKGVLLDNGEVIESKAVISTMHLADAADMCGLATKATRNALRTISTHVVGLGIRGTPSEELQATSWMYFPGPDVPFYRATVFSNYGSNVPPPDVRLLTKWTVTSDSLVPGSEIESEGPYWSLMMEVSEAPEASEPASAELIAACAKACVVLGLIDEEAQIVSVYHRRLPHGYPVPTLARDSEASRLRTALETARSYPILSRGRFGAFLYEVANQDHSFMQGVEAVERLVVGRRELTIVSPNTVNSRSEESEERRALLPQSLTSACFHDYEVVVAAYSEPLDWIAALPAALRARVRVFIKKADRPEEDVPDGVLSIDYLENVGRESDTFLRYIVERYDSLPSRVMFLQGYPLDLDDQAFEDFFDKHRGKPVIISGIDRIVSTVVQSSAVDAPYFPLIGVRCKSASVCDDGLLRTGPWREDKDVEKEFMIDMSTPWYGWRVSEFLGNAPLPRDMEWWESAQFSASRAALQRVPRHTWELCLHGVTDVSQDRIAPSRVNPRLGHSMERLWSYLLKGPTDVV